MTGPRPIGRGFGSSLKPGAMLRVRVAEASGQQRSTRDPIESVAGRNRTLLELGIREHDGAAGIHDHGRVGGQIEESAGKLAGKIHSVRRCVSLAHNSITRAVDTKLTQGQRTPWPLL